MFSDEYLDYWGEIFSACRLAEGGIIFEKFLEDPWRDLCKFGLQSAPASIELGFRPLLPRQVRVAQRIWKRWEAENRKISKSAKPVIVAPPLAPTPLRPVRSLLPPALTETVLASPGTPRKSAKPRSKELL